MKPPSSGRYDSYWQARTELIPILYEGRVPAQDGTSGYPGAGKRQSSAPTLSARNRKSWGTSVQVAKPVDIWRGYPQVGVWRWQRSATRALLARRPYWLALGESRRGGWSNTSTWDA